MQSSKYGYNIKSNIKIIFMQHFEYTEFKTKKLVDWLT